MPQAGVPGSPVECTNCGHPLRAASRFGDECGEPRAARQDYSIRGILRVFELSITDIDSKFWQSFILLFRKPGQLTRQFFDGRRTSCAKPLTLFVVLNVSFFVVQPYTGLRRDDLGEYVRVERDDRGRVTAIAADADGRRARMVRAAMASRRDTPSSLALFMAVTLLVRMYRDTLFHFTVWSS